MKYAILLLACLFIGCQSSPTTSNSMTSTPTSTISVKDDFDVQGHRGARGLYPENSIEGFKAALDLGVRTLELDLSMTKDAIVVVSHEPWMNAEICQMQNGDHIPKAKQMEYNIYQMTYNSVKNYDCGSMGNPRFPNQKKMKTYKPTFVEAVTTADEHAQKTGRPMPYYNAEIKRRKGYDGQFHPDYNFFAEAVMHDIDALGIAERTTVQCFDIQTLEYIHTAYPDQQIAYLVDGDQSVKPSLAAINFTPEIYSPHFSILSKESVSWLHEKGIKVIPWTVNEISDMKKLIAMGVDGIITDYPDRLMSLIKSK